MTFADVRAEVCRVVRMHPVMPLVIGAARCHLKVPLHPALTCALGDSSTGCVQANWLKTVGIGKGDAVAIYMGMTCELPSALHFSLITPLSHSISLQPLAHAA